MAQEYSFAELYRAYLAVGEQPRHDHLSQLFKEVQPEYEQRWRAANPRRRDARAAWRNWRGRAFKDLIKEHIHEELLAANKRINLSLAIASDADLSAAKKDDDLAEIRQAVEIDYGDYGRHLANFDLVVFDDRTGRLESVIFCKTTMRERLPIAIYAAQKIRQQTGLAHLPSIFVTLDEDEDLRSPSKKKNYAIVSTEFRFTYLLSPMFQETERIHRFSRFGEDLEDWGGGKCLRGAAGVRSRPRISSRRRWTGCRRSASRSMSAQTISRLYTATRRKRCANSAGAFSGWSAICSRRGPRLPAK